MPIDFTQQLLTFDGEPCTDMSSVGGKPTMVNLTLARACCNALLGQLPKEEPCDAEEHLTRFMLANRIRDNKAAELSVEEIAHIRPGSQWPAVLFLVLPQSRMRQGTVGAW